MRMFFRKKAKLQRIAADTIRPVYSIRQELKYLRPFVCPRYAENIKTYTEEDIQAAEQKLGYQLPIPVRELYLIMGDMLCRQNAPSLAPHIKEYFIPLEQLHWDDRYLLLYASTASNVGFGIDRKAMCSGGNGKDWPQRDGF